MKKLYQIWEECTTLYFIIKLAGFSTFPTPQLYPSWLENRLWCGVCFTSYFSPSLSRRFAALICSALRRLPGPSRVSAALPLARSLAPVEKSEEPPCPISDFSITPGINQRHNALGHDFHPLKGKLRGFYSVHVNGNWTIIFQFENGEARNVDLIDYH